MTDAPEARGYTTTLALELRDVGSKPYRYLEGRAVPYDTFANVGWFMEQHRSGSFKRSTNGRSGAKLPLLLFHDNQSMPIGHAEKWEHRSDGMHGIWRLNDSPPAQQAAAMAEAGDLLGLSIGFQDVATPVWELPRELDPTAGPDGMPRVTRVESRLVEVSMTPTPAFPDAEVTMVRTRARPPTPPEPEVDHWRRVLEGLRSQ